MKKSVVLPYERYQQLIQNASNSAPKDPSETILPIETEKPTAGKTIEEIEEPRETKSNKLETEFILACLPKQNRVKALRLLDYVNKHPLIDWNREGNLLVDDKPVEFSHIVDLIHDALNSTKYEPVGYDLFYKHLKGIPQSFINNPRRKSLIGGRLPPPGIPDSKPKPLNVWKAQWKSL